MKTAKIILFLIIISLLFPTGVLASRMKSTAWQADGPVYIVQAGDYMSVIASRFGLTLDEIAQANPEMDINAIVPGDRIIIPGLEGVNGVLTTVPVGFGETLDSLSRKNRLDKDFLIQLNHITSPSELFVGIGLILPLSEDQPLFSKPFSLKSGSSVMEKAIFSGKSVYEHLLNNSINHSWQLLPGEIAFEEGISDDSTGVTFSDLITSFEITNFPIVQGGTASIRIQTSEAVSLSGILVDMPLKFAMESENQYVALQGVHALLEPGPYSLRIELKSVDGETQSFEQTVLVTSGYYPDDPILVVDSATIDPTQNDTELAKVLEITSEFSDPRYWTGIFANPSVYPDCFTSRYGNRRLYKGENSDLEYRSFHTGLDFCGGEGLPITAPADGVVVIAEPMTIRGNATIIDHGWGVYSGIWHQSAIEVQPGQRVTKGEIIGYVGGTGRVTGAHLHWEVWVNGIQVNPMNWLNNQFP